MSRPVILSAVRTPVGRYGGALAGVRPDDLAALVVSAAVERAGVDPEQIEDVFLGCANQAGEDNRNVARMAVLLAGLPQAAPGGDVPTRVDGRDGRERRRALAGLARGSGRFRAAVPAALGGGAGSGTLRRRARPGRRRRRGRASPPGHERREARVAQARLPR